MSDVVARMKRERWFVEGRKPLSYGLARRFRELGAPSSLVRSVRDGAIHFEDARETLVAKLMHPERAWYGLIRDVKSATLEHAGGSSPQDFQQAE